MRLASIIATLALPTVLAACGAVRSYPLVPPREGPHAAFPGIVACASAEGLQIAQHPDSVNVQVEPGVWVQFMDQPNGFNMVVVVTESSPEADTRADHAKHKGHEIYRCALRGPGPR